MDQITVLKCGALIQNELSGEATAIRDYSKMLAEMGGLSVEIARKCVPIIEEIISDELHHEFMLKKLYEEITGIEMAKD